MAKKNRPTRKQQTTQTAARQASLSFPNLRAVIKFITKDTTGMDTTSVPLTFTRPTTHEDLKVLWEIEHLLNALPTLSRVHITLEEE